MAASASALIPRDRWQEPAYVPRSAVLPDVRPAYPVNDFRDITRQERDRARGFEDMMERDYQEYGQPFLGEEERYNRMADIAYEPLLRGRAGYTPYEQGQIRREGELGDLQLTPEEKSQIGMTAEEQRGIIGDPDRPFQHYNPRLLYGMAESGAARQREALGEGAPGMRQSVSSPGLYQDTGYAGRQMGYVSGLERGIEGSIDPSRLRVSEEFTSGYPISDEEIETTAELAGRGASTRYDADLDRYRQAAAASGMRAPMAEAALTTRLRRRGAIAGADATTSARLGGLAQQREQMRRAEQMRLAAESGLSDAQLRAAFGLSEFGAGVGQDIEYGRISGEQDVAGRRYGAERDILGARLQSEQDIGRRFQRTGEYTQSLGTGLAAQSEQRQAERERARYGLRQDAAYYRQGQRYGRGVDASDRLSDRSRDIAQERLGGEREGRRYLTGQQEYAGGRAEDYAGRRIDSFRAGTERTQGALDARLKHRAQPGGTERVFNTLYTGGSKSKFVG